MISCNQSADANTMLENSETRKEVMSSIAGNHNYMNEMMKNMKNNDHAMQMMQGNQMIMGHMMQGNGMQKIMKDSMMMKNMMQNMMKDGKMMGNMMQMMHKNGMMSEDCMLSCMKMMTEKGMDAAYAVKLIQYGWETITEAMKHGGLTNMMDRLSNAGKIKAFQLCAFSSALLSTRMALLYIIPSASTIGVSGWAARNMFKERNPRLSKGVEQLAYEIRNHLYNFNN